MGVRSTGKAGIGVKLLVLIGGVFETVANVTTTSVGGVTVNMIDATHLDSPDFYAEFLASLKSADEWTLTVQWDPANSTQDAIVGFKRFIEDRVKTTFRMDPSQLGITTGIEAQGYVSQYANVDFSPDGIMTRNVTIRPSGAPQTILLGNEGGFDFSDADNSGFLALL